MPFTFLLAPGSISVLILMCVDVDESRKECRRYLEEEAFRVYEMGVGEVVVVGNERGMDGLRTVALGWDKTE